MDDRGPGGGVGHSRRNSGGHGHGGAIGIPGLPGSIPGLPVGSSNINGIAGVLGRHSSR